MRTLNLSPLSLRKSTSRLANTLSACLISVLLSPCASAQPSASPEMLRTQPTAPLRAGEYQLDERGIFVSWPVVTYRFSISNAEGNYFDQLKSSDVRVKFADRPVSVGELRPTRSAPLHVVVLIDGSGSMTHDGGSGDKLQAAKDALLPFINSLSGDDTLTVFAFDAERYRVSDRSSDMESHKRAIFGATPGSYPALSASRAVGSFPREGTCNDERCSKYTDLYGAIKKTLADAVGQKIHNLIVVSDGMQDTADSENIRRRSAAAFEAYKLGQEREIAEIASRHRVRIFTIAIGDSRSTDKSPKNLDYVDAETLKNISNREEGGDHSDISLPDLQKSAKESGASYQARLTEELKNSFDRFRQRMGYDYELTLKLDDFPRDGREHMLEMVFPAGDASTRFPAVEYPFSWTPGQSGPVRGRAKMYRVFIDHPQPEVESASIGKIYFTSLGVLFVLAIIPVFFNKAQGATLLRAQKRMVSSSVITAQKKSPYIGQTCPNDASRPIHPGDVIVVCPQCGRAHHLSCWVYANYCCMVRNCPAELPIPLSVLEKHGVTPRGG